MLVEFMQTQDKRSAHQERCIGDMSKQLSKLAKAVETLCGALGPAMRDSIASTLGPQMSNLREIAVETRRAASDLNAVAAVARAQPPPSAAYYPPQLQSPGSPLGGPVPLGVPAGAAARRDAALLATALAPEIEHIVAEAIERGMSLAESGEHQREQPRRYREASFVETPLRREPRGESVREQTFASAREPGRDSPPKREPIQTSEREKAKAKTEFWEKTEQRNEQKKREERELREEDEKREREEREAAAQKKETETNKQRLKPKINSRALSEDETKKIHSAIRWNKPLGEIASLITDAERANCEDPRNGNRPIHIASQNGFTGIVKLLIAKDAEIDAVNAKGNTGLHMALGYDYDECADFLVSVGADLMVQNSEGHFAKNGLEGDKGPDGYVAPLAELREARTPEESEAALKRIAKEGLGDADKSQLVQCGLLKKKNFPESWPLQIQDAFRRLMMSM